MIEITTMLPEHWEAVKTIYEEGIATGNATFQTTAPTWQEWDAGHVPTCRFVAIENNKLLGWAALTAVSSRCVYAGVAEVSVYVAANARGKKIGSSLLQALVSESEKNGFWTFNQAFFQRTNKAFLFTKRTALELLAKGKKLAK